MKTTFSVRGVAASALLMLAAGAAQAVVAWDEDQDGFGDLSNSGLAPTGLSFVAGANTVKGSVGGGGPDTDRDYFSFVVPAGMRLSAVTVNPGTSVSGGASFFAIERGLQVTTTPTGGNIGDLLAFGHYGLDSVGTNLLSSVLNIASGSVPSGTYSVWVQETGGTVPYSFDFVLSAVPEPTPSALLVAGLTGLMALTGLTGRGTRRGRKG